jgi:hypothetical protein
MRCGQHGGRPSTAARAAAKASLKRREGWPGRCRDCRVVKVRAEERHAIQGGLSYEEWLRKDAFIKTAFVIVH